MRALLICLAGLLIAGSGCGGYVRKVEILEQPPAIEEMQIGRISADYESASSVIKSILVKELKLKGFVILDEADWVLSGDTDANTKVFSAFFQLTDDKAKPFVTWWYWDNELLLLSARRSPNEFAVYMAEEISSTLRE